MTGLAFDTLKAAKALRVAGFDERQAEAVVATIGDAVDESLVTKADLEQALRPLVTQEGLDKALDAQDKRFNDRLEARFKLMVVEADLAEVLQSMATKEDVVLSQRRTTLFVGAIMATGFGILAAIDGLL